VICLTFNKNNNKPLKNVVLDGIRVIPICQVGTAVLLLLLVTGSYKYKGVLMTWGQCRT